MKKVFKLSFLLALLLPTIAWAHDIEVNGIYYNLNNGEATVTFKGTSATEIANEYSGTVTIPTSVSYNGVSYPVTAVGDSAFYQSYYLDKVTVGNSVKIIGVRAFAGCGFTPSIILGNSVTAIGHGAFSNCYSLNSMIIPNTVTTIEPYAFSGCIAMTDLTIGNSVTTIGHHAFSTCRKLTSLIIPNSVTSIDTFAFSDCSGLTEVTIGTGVAHIGDLAFYQCTALETLNYNAITCEDFYALGGAFRDTGITTLNIGDGVQKLPGAFMRDVTGVTSINIPNSVTVIGEEAFRGCKNATSLTLGNSVTTIGTRAFYGCSGLTNVDIPNSVTTISYRAFEQCTGLVSATIGTGVITIDSGAFIDCTALETINFNAIACEDFYFSSNYPFYNQNLTTINIGESVQRIPAHFAMGITSLTSINIPNSVTTIGLSAFDGCSGLTSVTLGNSVTTIDVGAFYGCSGLTSVEFPNTLTTIEYEAFSGCSGLTSVTFPSSVTFIGMRAFYNAPDINTVTCEAITPPEWGSDDVFMENVYEDAPLYVPEGTVEDYMDDTFYWGQFAKIRAIGSVDVLATSISLNFTQMTLKVGRVYKLRATVLPEETTDKGVAWASSDPNVASVDQTGRVTAVAAGTATITATTVDGSNLSASCIFTVIPAEIPGDVNGDSQVNITDVTALVNMLLTDDNPPAAADVNGDSLVNITDVTALINMLLTSDD